MWKSNLQTVDRQTLKAVLNDGSSPLSYGEVIRLWRESVKFREFFASCIRECAFDAFFWETRPVTTRTLDSSFEFVLIESDTLSQLKPDPSPFAEHFASRASDEVLAFPNLGGDAILVVPAPLTERTCYTHLARFLRGAPASQVDLFWQKAGHAMQKRVSNSPTWLSTAGLGVSWLHLRLDSRPKYYRHRPYQEAKA